MIYTINGTSVAAQSEFSVEYNSQSPEGSGRDLSGLMYTSFLPFKYKLVCKWPIQNVTDRATLLTVIYGQPNMADLDILFLDPISGEQISKTFYVGTPASTSMLVNYGGSVYWSELSLNFIEV